MLIREETLNFILGINTLLFIKIKNINSTLQEDGNTTTRNQIRAKRTAYFWLTEKEILLMQEKVECIDDIEIKSDLRMIISCHRILTNESLGIYEEDDNAIITKEDLEYRGYFQTYPPATVPGTSSL